MTSARKQEANRRNASRSTGPKTPRGRYHSARNALQHGLSVASLADPAWAPEVRALAAELVAANASAVLRERAYEVAAAQIDIIRVGTARQGLLAKTLADETFEPAWRRKKREMIAANKTILPAETYARLMAVLSRKPQGEEKMALVLADLAKELLRLDRYERRARSRRRKAIRVFDMMAYGASGALSAALGAAGAFMEPERSS